MADTRDELVEVINRSSRQYSCSAFPSPTGETNYIADAILDAGYVKIDLDEAIERVSAVLEPIFDFEVDRPVVDDMSRQILAALGYVKVSVNEAVERAAKARYQRTTRFSHDEDRPWDTDYPAEVIKERFRDMVRETVQDALGAPNA